MTRMLAVVITTLAIQAEATQEQTTDSAKQWTAKEFLSQFLAADEDLVQAQSRLEVSRQIWLGADDLYTSRLSVSPTANWKDQTFSSSAGKSTYDDQSSEVTGRLVQSFPSGTELEFKAQGYMERTNPTLGGIDRQYTLTLNQPLWQNAFGRQWRLERDRALDSYEGEQASIAASKLVACEKGLNLYFTAYAAQEAERDHALILNSAEKALQIAKSAYQKRLVRPIDYMAAQADFLRIQGLKLQADQELSQSLTVLASYNEKALSALVLTDPSSLLQALPLRTHSGPVTPKRLPASRKLPPGKRPSPKPKIWPSPN